MSWRQIGLKDQVLTNMSTKLKILPILLNFYLAALMIY
jgi:hypothetical protein